MDSLSAEEIRLYRGTLTQAGKESPNRNRSIDENLDLFARMRAGEFADGQFVLRAKIDMASPNMNMRDPAIYRIRRVHHQRTGMHGAFTRCTITRIVFLTRLKALRIRFARWNLPIIARFMIGFWSNYKRRVIRNKLNLRGCNWNTRLLANEN